MEKSVPIEYRSYGVRWYILALYSIFAASEACVFNTWGPLAQSVKAAFGWTDAQVAWVPNVQIISGMLSLPLAYPVLQKFGFRYTVVFWGAGVHALGTLIRCVSLRSDILLVTSIICSALNGWAATIVEGTLTTLSARWFPQGERTTATGISIGVQMAGLIPSSLIFPRVVTDPDSEEQNNSVQVDLQDTSEDSLQEEIKYQVSWIIYIEAAVASFIFLAMLIYFPSDPPSPPSPSAQAPRYNFFKGMRTIFTKPRHIISGLAFGCVTVPLMWIAVVNQNLNPLGLSQIETGYIGTVIIGISFLMNIVNSTISDKFYGYLKTVICCFLTVSLAFSIWLALICLRLVEAVKTHVFISAITSMVTLRCTIAMFYELLMEVHYPAPEPLVTVIWGQIGRIFVAIFLAMFSILPGVSWMNYFLVGFTLLPIILLLSIRMQYNRSNIDQRQKVPVTEH